MANLISNIYPPIVPTYGDPFIIDSNSGAATCEIPFSISNYNSTKELASYIQITIFRQNTNTSALNLEKYPCGIIVKEWTVDREGKIEIYDTDIQGGFETGQFYKVQIRLTSSEYTFENPPNTSTFPQKNSAFLNEGQTNGVFSEWSTVCLIRGICKPELKIRNLEEGTTESSPAMWPSSGNIEISGRLIFYAYPIALPAPEVPIGEDIDIINYTPETDYLKEYSIKLYDENENLFYDSGTIYTDTYVAINEIFHVIKRIFNDGDKYRLEIYYKTKIGYEDTEIYYLLITDEGIERLNVDFTAIEDGERGRIILSVINQTTDIFNGNLIIRRTDMDSNFTVWEDVAIISINNQELNITWNDYTIQSGKWYQYGVQTKNNNEQRGLLNIYEKKLMIEFDDIFLNANNSQICIRYNPQISSFQHTISENKVDTIGSKYPFIKRNGNMNYKQFPISGLITYYMDNYSDDNPITGSNNYTFNNLTESENKNRQIIKPLDNSKIIENESTLFTSRKEMYGDVLKDYMDRVERTNSDTFNTVIYEKDFRDKVKEFLYANNIKLFRSSTEGNILVKLMNITFTPNQSLGRKVWSFNATAYEMDECSIENFDKYNIQTIGHTEKHYELVNNYIGQLHLTENDSEQYLSPKKNIITDILATDYQKYCKQNYIAIIKNVKYLKIQFNSKPYLIESGDNPIPSDTVTNNSISGYIVTLNEKNIVVNSTGIYELKNDNVQIKSISFPKICDVTIDYELELLQEADASQTISSMSYKKKIGQLRDLFDTSREIIEELKNKYRIVKYQYRDDNKLVSEWYQELVAVNGLHIEADEGTIVRVQEVNDEDYQTHIIGPTESLYFYDPETVINMCHIAGKHFIPANEKECDKLILFNNRFIEDDSTDISHPEKNHVYTINGQRKIYYQEKWYDIDEQNNIEYPVAAIIDYYCECVRGIYGGQT